MKDYEEFPESLSLNTLFYISNPQNFTEESIKKLRDAFTSRKQSFSIERLNKGKERALVIFGPRDLPEILPQLNLIEIEDYLTEVNDFEQGYSDKKVGVNQTLTRLVEAKINDKKPLHLGGGINNLELGEGQKFFIQIACFPENKRDSNSFQSTARLMIVDKDPVEKVVLFKRIKILWETATGLNIHEDSFPEQKKFESFKQRSLIPEEVAPFPLTSGDIFSLVS